MAFAWPTPDILTNSMFSPNTSDCLHVLQVQTNRLFLQKAIMNITIHLRSGRESEGGRNPTKTHKYKQALNMCVLIVQLFITHLIKTWTYLLWIIPSII